MRFNGRMLSRRAAGAVWRVRGKWLSSVVKARRPGPLAWYEESVAEGTLSADPHQRAAAGLLQSLHDDLDRLHGAELAAAEAAAAEPEPEPAPAGIFSRLFGGASPARAPKPRRAGGSLGHEGPRGLYLWGGVGCGKSMLMDAFFEASPVPAGRRRRVHFHEFMLDVHARIHRHRADGNDGDAVLAVAAAAAAEAQLLCFDEFQVTDVGDAMLMHRLFGRMFDRGVTMVATSNRPPTDLYAGGLQRELFEPCIRRVEQRCLVHRLGSPVDYRLAGHQAGRTWASGDKAARRAALEATWRGVVGTAEVRPAKHSTQGRAVRVPFSVPRAAGRPSACWFRFPELCAEAKGAADFLLLAKHYDVVFLADVPTLTLSERNEVRRFITLVDVLYEQRRRLFVSAARPMDAIFRPRYRETGELRGQERDDDEALVADAAKLGDEAFAFDRCTSRLIEMGSEEYLAEAEGRA